MRESEVGRAVHELGKRVLKYGKDYPADHTEVFVRHYDGDLFHVGKFRPGAVRVMVRCAVFPADNLSGYEFTGAGGEILFATSINQYQGGGGATPLTLEIRASWHRYESESRLLIPGQIGGGITLASVMSAGKNKWRWHAAGTTGQNVQRGDAENLAGRRLGFASHEQWMEHVHRSGYGWANVESMQKAM